jgi:hypothetical protein
MRLFGVGDRSLSMGNWRNDNRHSAILTTQASAATERRLPARATARATILSIPVISNISNRTQHDGVAATFWYSCGLFFELWSITKYPDWHILLLSTALPVNTQMISTDIVLFSSVHTINMAKQSQLMHNITRPPPVKTELRIHLPYSFSE